MLSALIYYEMNKDKILKEKTKNKMDSPKFR